MVENKTLIIEDKYGDTVEFSTSPTGELFVEATDEENHVTTIVEIHNDLAIKLRDFMIEICK